MLVEKPGQFQDTLDRKRVMQRDLMRLIQRFDQLKGSWAHEKAAYLDEEERLIRAGMCLYPYHWSDFEILFRSCAGIESQ